MVWVINRDKANNEVDNLKYLLNVDATKKETLDNRVETLENRVFDLEHDCAEATEELAMSLVFAHLLSYYLLLYLPNVCFGFALTLTYTACKAVCHTKSTKCGGGLQWEEWMTQMVLELLSHCTPPSCIATNILIVTEIICPHTNIVKELPSISIVRVFISAL